MSKETKIGLAAISVLVVVFSVVLARRLIRPLTAASMAAAEKPAPRPTLKRPGEFMEKERFSSPTVVSPPTFSVQTAKQSPDDLSRASLAAESRAKDPPGSATSGPQTAVAYMPSAMPAAPAASSSTSTATAGGTWSASTYGGQASTSQPVTVGATTLSDRASHFREPKGEESPPSPYENSSHTGYNTPPEMRSGARPIYPSSLRTTPPPPPPTYGDPSGNDPAGNDASGNDTGGNDTARARFGGNESGLGGGRNLARMARNDEYSPATAEGATNSYAAYSAASNGSSPYASSGRSGLGGRHGEGTYVVQPNDSLWSISEKLYGTGAYFKALAKHNREGTAGIDHLRVGDTLATPSANQLEQSYPDLCPKPGRREVLARRGTAMPAAYTATGHSYTVQEGDTLFDIARRELGRAARWAEIYDLNRDTLGRDFNYLIPGTTLLLPTKEPGREPTNRTTQRGGSLFER